MLSQKTKNRIEEIKLLKQQNEERTYQEYKLYYKNFKKPRPFSTANPLNNKKNNWVSNNKNYKYSLYNNKQYNPLVTMMITSTFDPNFLQTTNYLGNMTNRNAPKKFFGLDGKTKLDYKSNNNTLTNDFKKRNIWTASLNKKFDSNFNKNTKNNFYDYDEYDNENNNNDNMFLLTQYNNKNIFTKYNNDDEYEVTNAFYNVAGAKKRFLDKETKNDIYNKYNIENYLTENEENNIKNVLKTNYINNKNSTKIDQKKLRFNSASKIVHSAKDYSFKNPFQSYRKMKVKEQLKTTSEKIRDELLCQNYSNQFLNLHYNRIQTAKMPKINIKSTKNNLLEQHISKNVNNFNLFSEIDQNNNKKYLQEIIFSENDPKKKLTREELLKVIKIDIYLKKINFHPSNRTQFASLFDNGLIYLYGGLSGKKMGDLWKCNLKDNKCKWKKIYEENNIYGEPLPRYGHTMHLIDNKLYILGGEFTDWEENENNEGILCYFDIEKYSWNMLFYDDENNNKKNVDNGSVINNSLNNNKINRLSSIFSTKTHKTKNSDLLSKSISAINQENKNIFPEHRRNHISLLIGYTIFLYGGIDKNGNYLNDCWIYDIKINKWFLLEYKGRHPPALAYHSSCIALEKDQLYNEYLIIYKVPPSQRKTLPRLKCEGIFFFGGMNENRQPTNLFFRLILGQKPTRFDLPKIYGKPPSPRISCSMNFYSELNLIIIHGGRNDILSSQFLNDFWILDLENMNWVNPTFLDSIPLNRAEHQSLVIGNKLIIFGGINGVNLLNFDFTFLNLDMIPEEII